MAKHVPRQARKECINLHKLSVPAAQGKLEDKLMEIYAMKEIVQLFIITGRGAHSVNMEPKIRSMVENILHTWKKY